MILCIAEEVPGRLLQRFDYHMQPDGGNNEHGRLIKKTYTHYPENTPNTFSETYRWSKIIPAGKNDTDAHLQRETQLRHLDDAAPLTTTRVWRHASYALLSFTDAYGNTTRYHYAPEGYLEKTEHHADTPYASVSHRWLEESFRQNGLITLTRTDIQGNRIISHIDGFGRLHRRYYQCRQHPLNRLPIEQREYDPLGRLSRLTTYDHSDEEGPIRPLVTRYNDCAWDHWGHRYTSVDHDGQQGVCHYHHLDIIKQKSSKQTRSDYRSGRHGNAAPQYSGILYERYRHGKPLRQLRLLPQPDGKASVIISELRLNYDDQCRLSAVNERGTGQAIRWRYNDDNQVA
ncbi:hypothetical protein [Candidatus Sodalis pierantonius]|uniref:hypothetical protein n=1 Tax=Candidatus Sodalis pierantonii TaxID=1486991 RepID=UPI0011DDA3E5|nr:hypothetical protein [Candidatus Sodalis pierantonius]